MDFPYIDDRRRPLRSCCDDISYRMRSNDILSPATRRNDCCIRDGKWGLIKFTNLSVWWSSISRKFVNGVVVFATTPSRLIMEGYESIPNLFLRPLWSNVMSSVSFQLSTRRQRSGRIILVHVHPARPWHTVVRQTPPSRWVVHTQIITLVQIPMRDCTWCQVLFYVVGNPLTIRSFPPAIPLPPHKIAE